MDIKDFIDRDSFLSARDRFIREYCEKKGWSQKELTLIQIMEMRKQDGWKNPINTKDIRV